MSLGEDGCEVFVKESCYGSMGFVDLSYLRSEKNGSPGCLGFDHRLEGDGQNLKCHVELEHENLAI